MIKTVKIWHVCIHKAGITKLIKIGVLREGSCSSVEQNDIGCYQKLFWVNETRWVVVLAISNYLQV